MAKKTNLELINEAGIQFPFYRSYEDEDGEVFHKFISPNQVATVYVEEDEDFPDYDCMCEISHEFYEDLINDKEFPADMLLLKGEYHDCNLTEEEWKETVKFAQEMVNSLLE